MGFKYFLFVLFFSHSHSYFHRYSYHSRPSQIPSRPILKDSQGKTLISNTTNLNFDFLYVKEGYSRFCSSIISENKYAKFLLINMIYNTSVSEDLNEAFGYNIRNYGNCQLLKDFSIEIDSYILATTSFRKVETMDKLSEYGLFLRKNKKKLHRTYLANRPLIYHRREGHNGIYINCKDCFKFFYSWRAYPAEVMLCFTTLADPIFPINKWSATIAFEDYGNGPNYKQYASPNDISYNFCFRVKSAGVFITDNRRLSGFTMEQHTWEFFHNPLYFRLDPFIPS